MQKPQLPLNEYPAMKAQPEAYPRYASFHDVMNSVLPKNIWTNCAEKPMKQGLLWQPERKPTFDNTDALFDALNNEDA